MKILCLFRHAKSTWGSLGTDDTDRPLHPIGEANAPMMGNYLRTQGIKPDVILSSNAKRALTTAELIAEPLGYDKNKIVIENKIYDASVDTLIHILEKLDDKVKTVVLVGHNPGLTLLANYLADEHINNMPTCGVFCLEMNSDKWHDFATAESRIKFIDEPRRHT